MPTIHFYDALTVGKNAADGQLLGYDSILTDGVSADEIISQSIRLRDDVFLDPMSVVESELASRDLLAGCSELDWARLAFRHFTIQDCLHIGVGNSSRADPFIRHGFYRNLLPYPCAGYSEEAHSLDLETVLRAIQFLRPEEYPWPGAPGPDSLAAFTHFLMWESQCTGGNRALRVKDLVCEIAKASPRLLEHALKLSSVNAIKRALGLDNGEVSSLHSVNPSLLLHASIASRRGAVVGMPIGVDVNYPDILFVADLESDVSPLCDPNFRDFQSLVRMHPEDVAKPLVRISLSRLPFVAPLSVARKDDVQRLGINVPLVKSKALKLRQMESLPARLKDDPMLELSSQPADIYHRVWGGNFPVTDLALMKQLHSSAPDQWVSLFSRSVDGRFADLGSRMLGRESPESLPRVQSERWLQFLKGRVLGNSTTPDRVAQLRKEAEDNAQRYPSLKAVQQINERLSRILDI